VLRQVEVDLVEDELLDLLPLCPQIGKFEQGVLVQLEHVVASPVSERSKDKRYAPKLAFVYHIVLLFQIWITVSFLHVVELVELFQEADCTRVRYLFKISLNVLLIY